MRALFELVVITLIFVDDVLACPSSPGIRLSHRNRRNVWLAVAMAAHASAIINPGARNRLNPGLARELLYNGFDCHIAMAPARELQSALFVDVTVRWQIVCAILAPF